MDLQTSIERRLDTVFRDFLQRIAEHYNLDYDELCKFSDSLDLNVNQKRSITCMHVMTRGINKGKSCPSKALDNGYCGKHQGSATNAMEKVMKKTTGKTTTTKAKGMTKTQQQIIDWLNTAVPQKETVLKKRSKGLFHEDTEIIFDDDFVAIGKMSNGEIVKLAHYDVEICERQGWQYDEDAVEDDDGDDDGSEDEPDDDTQA